MSALKRVEAFMREFDTPAHGRDRERIFSINLADLLVADLRAVLALAKQADDLKRRLRLARDVFEGRRAVYDGDALDTRDAGLADLLDLRKPLPKKARR